jgi:uncharacterized protein DUF3810
MKAMRRRRVLQTAVVLLAAGAALLPFPAVLVERWYSTGFYPRLQRVLTPLANLVPFAWFDVILLTVVGTALTMVVRAGMRARRERRWLPVLHCGRTLVVVASVLYLVFLGCWGLNYRRVPMLARIETVQQGPRPDDLQQLGGTAVARLNALYDAAHGEGAAGDEWRNVRLIAAFNEAQQWLEDVPAAAPGRLKRTILGPYFRWTGVDGMVNPYALEVLVNPDLLPWERPFVAAHEWSHLAGFADESEASFVGWLACLRGPESAQYSGWLFLYWEILSDVSARQRDDLMAALNPGPRRDMAAVVERLRRGQFPVLRTASWAVYDQYLRANRVEEGIQSYGEVVTLILRARFDQDYRPVRRTAAASSR